MPEDSCKAATHASAMI